MTNEPNPIQIKKVMKFGNNGSHVSLPRSWIGKFVEVKLLKKGSKK